MLQHLFIFTAWRGWSTISSSVRNLGRQEASISITFSSRPGSCCPMHGSLESISWQGAHCCRGLWWPEKWVGPTGDKDTRRTDANRCPGGDQVQIPQGNLSTDKFLSKEQVAKGTVIPAMPRSSFTLFPSEEKYTESHRFCIRAGFSCLQLCLSKKWQCSSPSARMEWSFQPWCRFIAILRMHSHPKWVFWGMEAERDIPR